LHSNTNYIPFYIHYSSNHFSIITSLIYLPIHDLFHHIGSIILPSIVMNYSIFQVQPYIFLIIDVSIQIDFQPFSTHHSIYQPQMLIKTFFSHITDYSDFSSNFQSVVPNL
jgi:hypothetical protein